MLKIQNVKYPINPNIEQPSYEELIAYIYKYLTKKYYPKNLRNIKLIHKSIDARNKDLYYVLHATFNADNETSLLKSKNISKYVLSEEYSFLTNLKKTEHNKKVIVVGMGPAGIFNAYVLCKAGFDVTIIERGAKIEERIEAVDVFFNKGILNTETNIQYGEGGAGTFSDGKLATNVSSPYIKFVLETFVNFGAPKEILYEAKPHIGTNILRKVIVNIRNYLIKSGVSIYFKTKFIDFSDNQIVVLQEDKQITMNFDYLVLAIGHSATDTYQLLKSKKVKMEPKNFAVGVRIEHLQSQINKSLYHDDYKHLPPAEYKLVVHLDKRSVYTFCMCPGGFVVNASCEDGCLVTNGMSNHERNEKNANAALLVNVNVDDYYKGDVLDGIYFLREYEKKAFNKYGNHLAPVQLVGDFLKNVDSTSLGNVIPTIKPGYQLGNITDVLPSFITTAIQQALPLLDKKIPGFADEQSVLTGIETRSSAPVRIVRDDKLSTNFHRIYAIGEGAGYAGGITTSAIDGIKIAVNLIKNDEEK